MPKALRTASRLVLVLALALTVSACKKQEKKVEPKVKPPVIGQAGALRAGVDLSAPPFAGTDRGRQAGIDVDVAAAMADRLGLTLELLDVKPEKAADALKAGNVDIVLSVPLTGQALSGASLAGTYLDDAPALFGKVETSASVEPSLTIDSLGGKKVVAQKGSASFWLLEEALGEGSFQSYPSLREAFQAASNGSADYVAGDAVTGTYITRDFPDFRVVGQIGPATRLGVAVSPDNTKLQQTVRSTLDALAADGVLDTIRAKWVAEMPEFALPATEQTPTP